MRRIKNSRLFILGVFIYILYKGIMLLIGLNTSVLTLNNDNYTMKTKVKAIVIRDEYLIKSDTSGTLSLIVNENEKVQKSQKVATIYNNYVDSSINEEIYNLTEEIKTIEKDNNSFQTGILSAKKEQLKILEDKVKNNSTNYYTNISGVISYKYDNNEVSPLRRIKNSRLFILGVFIYILYKGIMLLIGLNTSVLTLNNDNYTMKTKVKAIVIRDEYLIKSDTSGTLSLIVNENEKVQKSQKVATIYNNYVDSSINEEIYNLTEEIKTIEKDNNSFQTGILSAKKEQLKILEDKVKNNSTNYYTNISGVISYKYDNNEDKYNTNNLSSITKDDIEKATNNYISASDNNKTIKPDEVIGRVIDDNEIYIAFVSEDNELFNEGDNVKIEMKKELINGEIYKKYKKKNYFITVVKITQQNIGIYDTREEEFDIIYNQMEALRIPRQSIVTEDNKQGVYVINEESNKPEFVELKGISFEDDEYIYIDFRSNEKSGVDTVNLHDRIILKPNFINKRITKTN